MKKHTIDEIKELRAYLRMSYPSPVPEIVDTLLHRVAELESFAEKSLMEFYTCAGAYWDTQEDLENALGKITGEPTVEINDRLFSKLGNNRRPRNYQIERNRLKAANAYLENRVAVLEKALELACKNGPYALDIAAGKNVYIAAAEKELEGK